jgi:hypothetical protein
VRDVERLAAGYNNTTVAVPDIVAKLELIYGRDAAWHLSH